MKLTEKLNLDEQEIERRKSLLHLTHKEVLLLGKLLPFIQKHIEAIVEESCTYLFKHPSITKVDDLNELKSLQRNYLLDLFQSNLDQAYFEKKLQYISAIHKKATPPLKWYIGAYSNLTSIITPLLAKKFKFRPNHLSDSLIALIKMTIIDQQLTIDFYAFSTLKKLAEPWQQVQDVTNILVSSANEILKAVIQLTSSAQQTAVVVSETTTTVEDVKQTAQTTNKKARYVSESAQKVAQISQIGKKSTEENIEGMYDIRNQMESIAESIVRLSEHNQTIGETISTVDDLAEQSNLLAVNASIEAAKAGEQGKGFSVVAQEIKNLAEQSKQATRQVRTILNDIQKATEAAVKVAEQGNKAVEIGVKQSTQAGKCILTLTNSITEATQAAVQIATSSNQQLAGTDKVVSAMQKIKQAATKSVEKTQQLEIAAESLNELGQSLKQLVEQNKVRKE